jgi:hypothetical protein
MTAERRLAKIESSLSPTELVPHWLEEAHRYDDVEGDGSVSPIHRPFTPESQDCAQSIRRWPADRTSTLASAEVYDPKTGTFSPTHCDYRAL